MSVTDGDSLAKDNRVSFWSFFINCNVALLHVAVVPTKEDCDSKVFQEGDNFEFSTMNFLDMHGSLIT